jgi:hypothetical protein
MFGAEASNDQQLPPVPNLIRDTRRSHREQRSWLNGFFAGLVSLDGAGSTRCRRSRMPR